VIVSRLNGLWRWSKIYRRKRRRSIPRNRSKAASVGAVATALGCAMNYVVWLIDQALKPKKVKLTPPEN
jgi:hypothetical protein